jgi:hypothetical protein
MLAIDSMHPCERGEAKGLFLCSLCSSSMLLMALNKHTPEIVGLIEELKVA